MFGPVRFGSAKQFNPVFIFLPRGNFIAFVKQEIRDAF
jgi:hypothetical protein